MIPDSIILLDADARLNVLLWELEQSRAKARAELTEEAWDANVMAWEAVHSELMRQLNTPTKVLDIGADK